MNKDSNFRLIFEMKGKFKIKCRKINGFVCVESDIFINIAKVENVSRETLPQIIRLW